MADRIMLATVRSRRATLWTQNPNLKNFEYVRYVDKNRKRKDGPTHAINLSHHRTFSGKVGYAPVLNQSVQSTGKLDENQGKPV